MTQDPFGDLSEWGRVLEIFGELADSGNLGGCQPGLVRILRFKGNWRLREEVLKRVGEIQAPAEELVFRILGILADDNIYYDARIIAGDALIQLLKNVSAGAYKDIHAGVEKVVRKLKSTPQPPCLDETLDRLYSKVAERAG
jgi:hypothetical protein